ncbi:MAG: helix-turn-helix domain-containing protein [bacterium]
MSVIATLLPHALHVQRLRAAIRDRHELRECADWATLARACDREPVRVAVVDLFAHGTPNFEGIRALKQKLPRLTLVAYVTMALERGHDLFDAGRAGIDGLVLAGEDDAPRPLLAIVEQAEARGLVGLIRRSLEGVDPVVLDAMLLAVTRAHERLAPTALAKLLAMSRRTATERIVAQGFPAPQRLLTWGRLVVAAHMLEDRHRSADRVANMLDFPSGSAFRNTCQRYLGATPGEIRAEGGASYVMRSLLEQVRSGTASLEEEPSEDAPPISPEERPALVS